MSFHPSREIVLLVDDSPDTLGMLTDALESSGLTVLCARDGESALSVLGRVVPDLILLDALMPGIDGFETCRRIKQDPRFVTIPVIFMTGLSDSADIVRGLGVGGVDYVTKPVDSEALIARISVHVANARIVAETRAALDHSGRAVMSLSTDASVEWASPLAGDLIGASLMRADFPCETRRRIASWLAQNAERALSGHGRLAVETTEGEGAEFSYLGTISDGRHLVRVSPIDREPPGARLSRTLGVTAREGEVLSWLADGKANRDIATILELSPRTVTKHLEQIYAKLGVENRTSAVALAIRALER